MIMTPALGFFYGGLVRRKNLVSTIAQCFAIFPVVSLVWGLLGDTLGPPLNAFIGSLDDFGLNNVGTAPNLGYSSTIPELLYFAFQLKFAAITPALIIGAFAERIRFKALLIYIVLWTTFVYVPIAHWNWGVGGWLKSLGVIDFAGGLVVHTAAGVSAVAAALVIGRRKGVERLDSRPNNIPYVILGASVLWFGWFGFNAGSALAANALAVNALVVTNLAAAGAAVSWMLTDWVRKKKPSAVGIAVDAVCGLVAITPASGCGGLRVRRVLRHPAHHQSLHPGEGQPGRGRRGPRHFGIRRGGLRGRGGGGSFDRSRIRPVMHGVRRLRRSARPPRTPPPWRSPHHCSPRIAAFKFFRSQRTRRRIPRVRFFRNQITSCSCLGPRVWSARGRANRTPTSRSTASDAAHTPCPANLPRRRTREPSLSIRRGARYGLRRFVVRGDASHGSGNEGPPCISTSRPRLRGRTCGGSTD